MSAESAFVIIISTIFQLKKQSEKAQRLDENFEWPRGKNPKDKKTGREIALPWQRDTLMGP